MRWRPSRLLFVKKPERRSSRAPSGLVRDVEAAARSASSSSRSTTSRTCASFDFAAALAGGGTPGVPVDHPLLVVCTHGKRDRCCAKNGRPLYDALRRETESGWVWQSTHVGGDRFAGNVVVFPQGLYYGRVEPGDAGRPSRGERRRPDRPGAATAAAPPTRSRCRPPSRRFARPRGSLGIDDLAFVGSRPAGEDAWRVRFRTVAGVREVDVAAELADEPVYLTCGAAEPSRPRHFAATAVRRLWSRSRMKP